MIPWLYQNGEYYCHLERKHRRRVFQPRSTFWTAHIQNPKISITVALLDFQEILTRTSPDILVYCDPPYVKTEKMYPQGFQFNHQRLSDALSEREFIVSYRDEPEVREIYSDRIIIETNAKLTKSLKPVHELLNPL